MIQNRLGDIRRRVSLILAELELFSPDHPRTLRRALPMGSWGAFRGGSHAQASGPPAEDLAPHSGWPAEYSSEACM